MFHAGEQVRIVSFSPMPGSGRRAGGFGMSPTRITDEQEDEEMTRIYRLSPATQVVNWVFSAMTRARMGASYLTPAGRP